MAIFGSTHVDEEFLFPILPSILTFDFDLILGSFVSFWGPNGLILEPFEAEVGFKNSFGVYSYRLITFFFRVLLYFCVVVGGGWVVVVSQRLLSLNPTTVLVVLLLGL